jgi:N4-gp56 family major capsid protein
MALLNAGLGGATVTPGLTIQLKTTYNRTLLDNARDKLVHRQFGREYTLPKGGGLTMEFRKANTLPVPSTPLVEGVAPTEDTFGYTSLTVTIAQYGAFVKGSDVVQVVTFDPLLDNISEEQGVQAGLTVEQIDRDTLATGTVVRYAGGVAGRINVAAANKLSSAEIVIARRTLVVNKAEPVKGKYYAAIVHPFTSADLIQDPSIVAAMNSQAGASASGTSLFEGELLKYMGVVFTESTMAKVFTGAGAGGINVYGTLFFGKNAYGVLELEGLGMETIYHPKGSAGAADPLNQYWTHGWKCTHAIKILQDTFMLRLEHAATP